MEAKRTLVKSPPELWAELSDMTALARHLVESERWLDESARRLLQDLTACGPLQPVA